MTLVYRQKKQFELPNNKIPGPGYYDPDIKIQKNSIPSNSSIFRLPTNQPRVSTQSEHLGPGCYQIQAKSGEPAKNSCAFIFKSKQERFLNKQEAIIQQKKQYEEISCDQTQQINQNCSQKIGKLKKPQNSEYHYKYQVDPTSDKKKAVPSIPCNKQSYGYRIDNQTNQLILNQNPNVLLEQYTAASFNKKHKSIRILLDTLYNGPGTYFRNNGSLQKSRGLKWNKQPSRFNKNPSQEVIDSEALKNNQNDIGNDFYKNRWQQKGNAFTSKEKRTLNLITGHNHSQKQQFILKAKLRKFEPYLDQLQIAEALQKQSQLSNIKQLKNQQQNCSSIECFLSKQARFENSPAPVKEKNYVEHSEQEKQNIMNSKKKSKPFHVGAERFQSSINRGSMVGPGHYSNPNNAKSYKIDLGSYWAKQSEHKQFHKEEGPGPGQYQTTTRKKQFRKLINKKSTSLACMRLNNDRQNHPHVNAQKNVSTQDIIRRQNTPILKPTNLKAEKQNLQKYSKRTILKQIQALVSKEKDKQNLCTTDSSLHKHNKEVRIRQYKPLLKLVNNKSKTQQNKKLSTPGPGSFEVSKGLVKKTHNVTYN